MSDTIKRLFFHDKPDQPDVLYEDLATDNLQLRLIKYAYGSAYVGRLPCWFFSIYNYDGDLMGACDLRCGWSPEIAYAGHIGYRIFPPFRGHGYAQEAARLLLGLAHRLKMETVIITCDPDNHPSRRTLENLQGHFDGIAQVPRNTPAWRSGDREKCQFWYKTANYPIQPTNK